MELGSLLLTRALRRGVSSHGSLVEQCNAFVSLLPQLRTAYALQRFGARTCFGNTRIHSVYEQVATWNGTWTPFDSRNRLQERHRIGTDGPPDKCVQEFRNRRSVTKLISESNSQLCEDSVSPAATSFSNTERSASSLVLRWSGTAYSAIRTAAAAAGEGDRRYASHAVSADAGAEATTQRIAMRVVVRTRVSNC